MSKSWTNSDRGQGLFCTKPAEGRRLMMYAYCVCPARVGGDLIPVVLHETGVPPAGTRISVSRCMHAWLRTAGVRACMLYTWCCRIDVRARVRCERLGLGGPVYGRPSSLVAGRGHFLGLCLLRATLLALLTD